MSDPVANIPALTARARRDVSLAVQDEIDRVDRLARDPNGPFHGTHLIPGGPDHDRMYVLGEEVGEVNTALKEIKYGIATREEDLYVELIQTAATAEAWAAAILEGRS